MDTRARMREDGLPYEESCANAKAILDGANYTEADVDRINLVPDHLRGLDRYEAANWWWPRSMMKASPSPSW